MQPAPKIKAIMIFIASSELVFKKEEKFEEMFMDFRVLSDTKRLDCRIGQSTSIWEDHKYFQRHAECTKENR